MTKKELEATISELGWKCAELAKRPTELAVQELEEALQAEREHAWKLLEFIKGS